MPLSSVVPTLRPAVSVPPSLSTGKPSLVQIAAACAPGRASTTFFEIHRSTRSRGRSRHDR
jgi:hypothetical protein